jgi:hypothetical protein
MSRGARGLSFLAPFAILAIPKEVWQQRAGDIRSRIAGERKKVKKSLFRKLKAEKGGK